jgi:prepilin-type N-terminal cleavage/methylation domain-containing protein
LPKTTQHGFTLIELSIVLVIIGLIVGGVLTGQDLIRAAEVRATISQIEKFQTAANTFYGKYGYLPGDIKDPDATHFGFVTRGTAPCQGDGNGIVEGWGAESCWGVIIGGGETAMFWVDLSTAHLIDGNFSTASPSALPPADVTGSAIDLYLPQAKIGGGNYIYVWSGLISTPTYVYSSTGINYFGIAGAKLISSTDGFLDNTTKNISVAQAYALDKKVDDGFPLTGHVIAAYLTHDSLWADGTDMIYDPPPTDTPASATSCFDNGGVSNALEQYSLSQSNGAGKNCALSFEFQ